MVKYNLSADKPNIACLECGNRTDFTVCFQESYVEVEYRNGRIPIVTEWTDTGRDCEVTCVDCGSQDIEIDESFFG